jgi:hypothetical protein
MYGREWIARSTPFAFLAFFILLLILILRNCAWMKPHSNSKGVVAALQFPAARWSRIGREILDCPKYSPLNYRSEPAQIFLRRPRNSTT